MPTIRIPINITNSRISSLAGNAYKTIIALTNVDKEIWNFVKDVDGKIYGFVEIPVSVSGTPNAKLILTVGANATTGVTRFNVGHAIYNNNGASYNVALTSNTSQDITVPATARNTKEVSFTLTGTFTAKYLIEIEIFHEGAHANDTLAVDTELIDAQLEIDVV